VPGGRQPYVRSQQFPPQQQQQHQPVYGGEYQVTFNAHHCRVTCRLVTYGQDEQYDDGEEAEVRGTQV
jgi:hypothetical protein